MDPAVLWDHGRKYYARDLAFAALDRFQLLASVSEAHLARSYNAAGIAAMKLIEYDRAEYFLNQAIQAAHDPETKMKALGNLALLHLRTGKAEAALVATQMAEAIMASLQDDSQRISILTMSSIAHGMLQNWTEALARTRIALEFVPAGSNSQYRPVLLNNLGVYLEETGKPDEAHGIFLMALAEIERTNNTEFMAIVCSELAHMSLQEGHWDTAVRYTQQAIDYLWNHMSQVDKQQVARLCELFGRMALLMGDRRRAIALLERAAAYYAQLGLWREWGRSSQLLRGDLAVGPPPGDVPQEVFTIMRYFTDLFGLLDTVESSDPTLRRRGELVTMYALRLGANLGVDDQETTILSHAGRLCDIGLTTFESEAIRDEEGHSYKLHPNLSAKWLGDFPLPPGTADVVRSHHERYDGTGFPEGLKGEQIPLGARILAVCEAYVRSMQAGLAHDEAAVRLQQESGGALDPALVTLFSRMHDLN
jgi:HD-GYP domain-containing protein (c-di-GMP phosphodiesterase class II)